MRPSISFFISCLLLFVACNDNKKKESSSVKQQPSVKSTSCYQYNNNKDTFYLELNQSGESVTGTLNYLFYEKDRNTGTIRGTMQGDLLIADYTFYSEGTVSTRQVVFKKVGDYYIEGYGDMDTDNNMNRFKDIPSLQYDDAIRLREINCSNQ